jgi:hypothetical protein
VNRIHRALVSGAALLAAPIAGAQGTITGTVFDSLRAHAPLASATVVLIERDLYATTDATGRFRFDGVPAGRYTLSFLHPVLDSLDLTAPVVPVQVTDKQELIVALASPSATTIGARLCPMVHDSTTGVVIGRLRDVDDRKAVSGATVSTEWTEYVMVAGGTRANRLRASARTNPTGAFLLCGVPADVPLKIRAELGGMFAGPLPLLLGDRLIGRADLSMSRKDSAALGHRMADSTSVVLGYRGSATLTGTIHSTDGHAVRDAVVDILGSPNSARTDANGAFKLAGVPAGTREVDVRAIGFEPLATAVDFPTGATRQATFALVRQVQTLATDTVRGRSRPLSLMAVEGFDQRRQIGMGTFLVEADLAKHNYSNLTEVMNSIKGVHVEYGTNGQPMIYLRGNKEGNCIPTYFIDGTPFVLSSAQPGGGITASGGRGSNRITGGSSGGPALSSPFNDLSLMIQPNMIKGMEVYDTSAPIPAQYDRSSTTGCGSVVIWTR